MSVETKVCEVCKKDLPLKAFYSHKKGGLSPLCRTCTVADNKLRRQDPEGHKRALLARKEVKKKVRAEIVAKATSKCCSKCDITKPLESFRCKKRGLFGRNSLCIECERIEINQYYEKNKDIINQRKRERWAETERSLEQKGGAAKRAREWYISNKGRAKENQYRWIRENRDAFNLIQARRRAQKARIFNSFTLKEWRNILKKFNYSCAYCFRSDVKLTIDHVIPLSKGGLHIAENIVPACRSCNSRKGNRPVIIMFDKAI